LKIAHFVLFTARDATDKLKRGHPQRRRQLQVGSVKNGYFRTRYNLKTSTVASVVNLVGRN